MSQSNQNTPYSKPSNRDDFVLKEAHLGVDTTSLNINDSSPPQHGIRGAEGHISGQLNKAIEGRQRAIAAVKNHKPSLVTVGLAKVTPSELTKFTYTASEVRT